MLPPSRAGRITSELLLATAVFALFGCNTTLFRSETVSTKTHRAVPLDQIHSTTEHQSIKASFFKGNWVETVRLLVSLSRNPGQSAAKRHFLQSRISFYDASKKLPDFSSFKIASIPPQLVNCRTPTLESTGGLLRGVMKI